VQPKTTHILLIKIAFGCPKNQQTDGVKKKDTNAAAPVAGFWLSVFSLQFSVFSAHFISGTLTHCAQYENGGK